MLEWLQRNWTGVRLFLLSMLILYLELALIRFTSAEVLGMGYFANFVLISVFLGIGIGFLLSHRRWNVAALIPQALLLCVAFILLTHIDVTYLREHSGQIFFGGFGSAMHVPLWLSLLVLFVLSTLVFTGLGQEAGRCFGAFKPITAYSIDIAGSLTGIAIFTLHSSLGIGPKVWFALGFVLLAVVTDRWAHRVNAVLMGVGVLLLLLASAPQHLVTWSPYQRIDVWPMAGTGPESGAFNLSANGIGHQSMRKVGEGDPIYEFPYTDLSKTMGGRTFDDVLIIGAGSGTDVAYALHYGAKRVDAVEIDPAIMEAGRLLHPEAPYADPRVHIHVNDGRAFMERSDHRYDLVLFALPDSLASLSNFANIRLESFLFTVQSFRQAQQLLKDGGVLVLYNYYRKQWLVEKLAGMLEEVFGHPPAVRVYSDEGNNFLAALAVSAELRGPALPTETSTLATDNWPFLYMETPHLPTMYIWVILGFIGCAILGVVATGHGTLRGMQRNGAFALMGAAFLLLETKSIIQFSLLFGATWLVNSLVFFAILASVLIANLIVHRLRLGRPWVLFALLLGAIVVQLIVPLDRLLAIESFGLRYLVASLLLFSPIFFANLVFGYLFRDTPKSAQAFGWNIIGTIIGASLEYTSIVVGYQALTVVILLLYAASFFWTIWTLRGRTCT